MMPILPFWWDALGLLLCLGGLALLALASEREGKVLLHRPATARERFVFRLSGWPLLVASLALAVQGWCGNFGPFLWFGWLTVAALAVAFSIAYWPWRSQRKPLGAGRAAPPVPAGPSTGTVGARHVVLVFGLIVLPAGFGWALWQAPVHPLLRADAVRGQVGPWSFTLVEEEQKAPETTPSGVPVKHLMLRFCDACDAEIRTAYLKLRPPRPPLALGTRLVGERWEREATLAIPPGLQPRDRLWLTVVGKDGQVNQTALDVARVSPAAARFIGEKTP
ncbi:DUF3325 domain-containing protein [Pseudothauera rhizosphaerae]|uniref:DUF3325 domain-containing protein n=1 Tax=Pseudothauera rhizosphaerae TaxID=2565932 RepID=A0A4S4ARV3_9RHOO|nr:DUF3325 domain-containing protein [Pseudothauera rhizosphaerae]THF62530.1 DUF3325 domain-containing protein [Pseudothauera rhizosphaerae]